MSTKYLPVRRSTIGPITAASSGRERRADEQADRPGHAEPHHRDRRAIGAERHEGGVAEADVAGADDEMQASTAPIEVRQISTPTWWKNLSSVSHGQPEQDDRRRRRQM